MLPAVLVLAAALAAGQITESTLTGRVTDPNGDALPGVSITVVSEAQGTSLAPVATGADGLYVVPLVTAGTYTVVAEVSGYRTTRRSAVALSGGDRVVVDLRLEIAGTETITVDARVALQAASGERSSVVDATQLEHLPIAGHDFQQFVALTPGVSAHDASAAAARTTT